MKRAAIFIGVDNTGGLPQLNDAARSAKRMAEEWAKKQGISPVKVLTDEGGRPVTAKRIKDAVNAILKPGNVEQLVIYFAGHGINKASCEYWLLSGAPVDPQEAVNLKGSWELAKRCGVPHVVFISDACRTAADSIGAQRVTGSEIFPNKMVTQAANLADLFYACSLGDPSLEVKDSRKSARSFRAVYTAELLDALGFKHRELPDWVVEGAKRVGYIRTAPLKAHLTRAVPARIRKLGLKPTTVQVPDAELGGAVTQPWLSRMETKVAPATGRGPKRAKGGGGGGLATARVAKLPRPGPRAAPPAPAAARAVRRRAPATAATVSTQLLAKALGEPGKLEQALVTARGSRLASAKRMARAVAATAPAFGPTHQESRCGFKIRGARIVAAVALAGRIEVSAGFPADVVRVWDPPRPGTEVLLVLDSGCGAVLPAIPEFLAALTVEDGRLVDVAYEPSEFTPRWNEFQGHATELRSLRAVVASATRSGAFRLRGEDALVLAQRMQYSKGVDPSLAVYAAYAYDELGRDDLIARMNSFLRDDLGAPLFDVAMLARALGKRRGGPPAKVLGIAPLLAQGWSLLGAHRVALPRELRMLPHQLASSVWTLFDPDGVKLLKKTLFRKGPR